MLNKYLKNITDEYTSTGLMLKNKIKEIRNNKDIQEAYVIALYDYRYHRYYLYNKNDKYFKYNTKASECTIIYSREELYKLTRILREEIRNNNDKYMIGVASIK